jgi:hypothetical protein
LKHNQKVQELILQCEISNRTVIPVYPTVYTASRYSLVEALLETLVSELYLIPMLHVLLALPQISSHLGCFSAMAHKKVTL